MRTNIASNETVFRCRNHVVRILRARPLIMGIVNVNDDSFSGDGTLDINRAMNQARQMVMSGAAIIDVGAESARTNRQPITEQEEIDRLLPFIERFSEVATDTDIDDATGFPPLLSVNTWRPEVVERVLATGAVDILNDIGGLPDDRNARLCAASRTALIIMHSVGQPKVPHLDVEWADPVQSVAEFFAEKFEMAKTAGLDSDRVILDPGIDFAKQRDANLRIYKNLGEFERFDQPLLVPVSRKTVVGDVLGLPDPASRDAGTVACLVASMIRGGEIFRVHNVAAARQAAEVFHAITESTSGKCA